MSSTVPVTTMSDSDFTFRISDVYQVPRRGWVVRLKLLEGTPSVNRLKPGATLWLTSERGEGRSVGIKDIAVTSGRVTQERFERKKELDVLISDEDAAAGPPLRIGWRAHAEQPRRSLQGSTGSVTAEQG